MVDIMTLSSYGYRLGALRKWALDSEDPLSTAINDFPKRGIIVNMRFIFRPITMTDYPMLFKRSTVPNGVWNLISRIPNKRWRQMCDSDKIMAEVNLLDLYWRHVL